ncbi:MAG: MCE family protein, partial [Gemmatimonadales bacterium]|nr:MCE family protein [Gemmatimonadales bacterium]
TSSAVRVSGVPVGKVEAIRLVRPGLVLVYVSLREDLAPKTDASAMVVSIGFVGDAVVDIDPGKASQKLPKNQPIMGTQQVGFTDRATQLGDRADSVLIGAQAIVNQKTADQLYATMAALQGTLKAAERTMAVYGNPNRGPTAEISRTMTSLQTLSARLDSTLANPALARTLSRTDTLTGNLSAMTTQLAVTGARLDTVLANVSAGRGTIGKFATDSGLYRDMRDLSQSMRKLVDEFQKHPGKIPVTVKIF